MGKQTRTISRRQRLAIAAAAQRQARRNRTLAAAGGLIIAGLLAAIAITVVNAAGDSGSANDPRGPKTLVVPTGATSGGAIPIGNPEAPVTVEVYLDYMCPFCGRFDRANADELNRLIADGTVRLELHPLSFLDRMSNGTRYSTRTANAIATVADKAPDKVLAFSQTLFAQQPGEGSDGLSDHQIAQLALTSGVLPQIVDTFPDRTFEPWIVEATDTAFGSGITGTPTVKINGRPFKGDLYTRGSLTNAIIAAKGTL